VTGSAFPVQSQVSCDSQSLPLES